MNGAASPNHMYQQPIKHMEAPPIFQLFPSNMIYYDSENTRQPDPLGAQGRISIESGISAQVYWPLNDWLGDSLYLNTLLEVPQIIFSLVLSHNRTADFQLL